MPQSYQEHNGDNSTHTFTIAFGSGTTKYLKREHIKLYYGRDRVAGTQTNSLTLNTDYVYISDLVIKLIGSALNTGVTVGDPYPLASGRKLTIERDTPQDTLLVPWADGSNLTKEALETSNLQVLFGQQEEADTGSLSFATAAAAETAATTATNNVATLTANYFKRDGTLTMTGNLQLGTNKITGVGDPSAAQDVVTKAFLERTGSIASAQILDGTIVDGDINASAAISGSKLQASSGSNAGSMSSAHYTKLENVESNAKDDQTAAEIKSLYESNSNTNAITDTEKTNIGTIPNKQPLDSELTTLSGMQAATASKLASGTALTSDIADLNQIDGLTKQTTISNSDDSFPTSGAVVDYVAAQISPLGGLEVVATEIAFPNTQPASGVVISISDAGGVVINGSGVSTTGRTVGGSTITINGFPSSLHSETLVAGVGLMVSSTGSSQTYNYHKILGKEDDIKQLSDDINDFNARYRVGSSNPSSALDAGDLFFNTSTSKLLVYNATNTAWEEAQSIGNFYISTLSPAFNGSLQDFTITNAPTNAEQILLSINGVIQKPNAGTSTPSEGFALSGSTVKLGAAPASTDTYFAVVIGSSVNIGTPSNNTVTEAILQSNVVSEEKLKVSNSPTNGYVLTARSGNTGGMTWEAASGGGGGTTNLSYTAGTRELASSSGTNVNLPEATTSNAGLQSSSDKTKLDGIETSATADMTGAEIKTAYESESDTNAFTDSEKTKLSGIATGATNTAAPHYTSAIPVGDGGLTQNNFTDALKTKLDGLVSNATHTGEVTGSGALTIADNVVDEANLKVSNAPTNGYVLTAQSGDTGGLTWAAASGGGGAGTGESYVKLKNGATLNDSGSNTMAGVDAGNALNASSAENTLYGYRAGKSITDGDRNNVFGLEALESAAGNDNCAFGKNALQNCVVNQNVAVGNFALKATTNNTGCIAVGHNAVFAATDAGALSPTRGYITAIGHHALKDTSTVGAVTAVGGFAGENNTTGASNTYVGYGSGRIGTTSGNNTGIGYYALYSNTANDNVAVGTYTLDAAVTGENNVAVGNHALTTNTSGKKNTAVGHYASAQNLTGEYTTAVGEQAARKNTVSRTTAIGAGALTENTSGTNNTAVGYMAGSTQSTADHCTLVGDAAFQYGTGNENTVIGSSASSGALTGSNNTIIGYDAEQSANNASNEVVLGNSSIATLRCQVSSISALSDRRDKTDINTLDLGLDFINSLKPVKFKWDSREGIAKDGTYEAGFIAQDFQQVQKDNDADYLNLVLESNPEKLEAAPGKLIPILVRAVQEMSKEIATLKAG